MLLEACVATATAEGARGVEIETAGDPDIWGWAMLGVSVCGFIPWDDRFFFTIFSDVDDDIGIFLGDFLHNI